MEYYIFEMYKKKYSNNKLGLERFKMKERIIVVVSLVVMVLSCVEMSVTLIFFPKDLWYLIGVALSLLSMSILFGIENRNQKVNLDMYLNWRKERLRILKNVLDKDFNINTKTKTEELLCVYQEYVDEKNETENKRNRLIFIMFSAFASILTISFGNMGLIGIDFNTWVYFALILLVCVSLAGILMYSCKYFDSKKANYEMMIKDIKELMIMYY